MVDKVFGLHNLASYCCRAAIPIDYVVSWHEICARMLQHYMHEHIKTDSLDFAMGTLQEFHHRLRITPNEYMASFSLMPSFLDHQKAPDDSLRLQYPWSIQIPSR